MHASPIHAVPKPHSEKMCMIINQSTGPYAPNMMIKCEDIKGFPLDNMRHLGDGLLACHHAKPNQRLVLFKSDVAEAYWLLPMHPLWQIKQIITIDNECDVDHNNCFGGRGSAGIYISFNGLVTWIAKNIQLILDLWTYMDDSFRIDEEGNVVWYHKYDKHMPANQVKLLLLWDKLGIPHEPHKHLFGKKLTIIGIDVNTNSLTLTLPKQALEDLLHELEEFTSLAVRKRTLHHWQQLAGWLNWSFNVFPMIHSSLNNLYLKIAEKQQPLTKIWVNNTVRKDLMWAMMHLRESLGIRLLSSITWEAVDADKTIFCNACMEGLGFWYPNRHQGFYSPVPWGASCDIIFYYEALAVTSALDNLYAWGTEYSKIIIFSDSMNTVDIFSSLCCQSEFNPLLRHCIDILLSNNLDVHVLHIPGEQNEVADAISHHDFDRATRLVPGLHISAFQPPHFITMGASKK